MNADESYMRRALALAERGRGYVEPNPLVGAVVVRDGKIVGEGWHERFGGPHAEVNSLAAAGEAARRGTLFVALEPCCHHGKTPPCTEAVIRSGVARVVAAMEDPFAQVAGRGAAQLRAAGIEVEVGLGGEEAARVNAPYLTLLRRGRPYVHAKWAMTLDGKIATRSGDSKWISNEASRRKVHELRGRMDGILVGSGTALADDPLLTARPPGPRVACRVVLDGRGRLPLENRLVRSVHEGPVLVATTAAAPEAWLAEVRAAGCEALVLPAGPGGGIDLAELMRELGRRRWTNLLVEGGAEVLGSFLDAGMIDEAHVFIAPKVVGGAEALGPMRGMGVEQLSEALRLMRTHIETLDGDVYVRCRRSD